MAVYRTTTRSSQPQRRARPVVTPTSCPIRCSSAPISHVSSVGKPPPPTRVVYALTTPWTAPTLFAGSPSPEHTPPTVVDEEVTYG